MIPFTIPLKTVHYDPMARGVWCRSPYPNHPKGCPNFPKCIQNRPDFREISDQYRWVAVREIFNLKAHAEKMKEKFPGWSDRQCRNPLYWQGGIRSRLRKKAESLKGDIILDIPEACGVNVFETMESAGIALERSHPEFIQKIMLVGFNISEQEHGDSG